MNYAWHDFFGNIGVLLILAAYLLLQLQKLAADRWLFSVVNGLGAFLLLISLTQDFNLSAFLMELAWLLISVYGLREWYRRRQDDAKPNPQSDRP